VVSFAAEAWREYVPIRMADMICVQEHLPSGAAAVLINQTHTNRDLILPITAAEKRWLDGSMGTAKLARSWKDLRQPHPNRHSFSRRGLSLNNSGGMIRWDSMRQRARPQSQDEYPF
jgi:hypothetical protein